MLTPPRTDDPSTRRPAAPFRLLIAFALCAACGGDSPSTPSSGAAPAAPAPAPPPTPPTVAAVSVLTAPFDSIGYVVGDTIRMQVTFNENVSVSGDPTLALTIGASDVPAAFDEEHSQGAFVAFRYDVRHGDRDEDGLSIAADALDLGDSTIQSGAGVDADVALGAHAIENLPDQLVAGTPPQRVCTDEAQRARDFARPMREWDGTPFRVDIVRNFPDFVTEADLQQLLDPIGRLADQIELQLGYPVLEMGDLIEAPAGAPAGWNQDFDRYVHNDLLPRERGQLLAFYLNDDNDFPWGGSTGSPMSAHVCCGTASYNKRSVGPMWTGNDPCCQGDANQYTREGEVLVHELFHVLGFVHADVLDQGVRMSLGALDQPWLSGSLVYFANWQDIEALRCIFPEGG